MPALRRLGETGRKETMQNDEYNVALTYLSEG